MYFPPYPTTVSISDVTDSALGLSRNGYYNAMAPTHMMAAAATMGMGGAFFPGAGADYTTYSERCMPSHRRF